MKDDLSDPYGLYEESYYDSVRARDKKKEPENAGSKNQSEGRGDKVSPEKAGSQVHKPSSRKKKGAKRRKNNSRTRTQNENHNPKKNPVLDKILS